MQQENRNRRVCSDLRPSPVFDIYLIGRTRAARRSGDGHVNPMRTLRREHGREALGGWRVGEQEGTRILRTF